MVLLWFDGWKLATTIEYGLRAKQRSLPGLKLEMPRIPNAPGTFPGHPNNYIARFNLGTSGLMLGIIAGIRTGLFQRRGIGINAFGCCRCPSG